MDLDGLHQKKQSAGDRRTPYNFSGGGWLRVGGDLKPDEGARNSDQQFGVRRLCAALDWECVPARGWCE